VKIATIAKKELGDLVSERVYIMAFFAQMVIVMGIVFSALLYTSVASPQPGGMFTQTGPGKVKVGLVGDIPLELEGIETVAVEPAGDPFQVMASRGLVALLVVPEDFRDRLSRGETARVELYLDNTNVLSGYADGVISSGLAELSAQLQQQRLQELGVDSGVLSRVELQEVAVGTSREGIRASPDFYELMYGLLVPFILLLPTFLASNMMTDSIVGEKEKRTYELILTAPITRWELVMGKAAPIVLLAGIQAGLWILLLMAKGIPVYNPLKVLALLLLLDTVFVGFGIAISAFSQEIKDANIGVTILLILSSILFFAPVTVKEGFYALSPVSAMAQLASNPGVPLAGIWHIYAGLALMAGGVIYLGSRLLDVNDNLRL